MHEPWIETCLDDVADITIGKTPPRNAPRYWTDELSRPFCTIADMKRLIVRPIREGVTALAEAEGKAKRVPRGSLLMSFKLTLGRVGFAGTDLFPNEAIAWLRVRTSNALPEFLALWLSSLDLEAYAGRAVKGNTLNGPSLRAIPILLPPLAEQRRIVDLIAAVDAAIEGAERISTRSLGAADSLQEEALSSAPETAPLGDLLVSIEAGKSPPAEKRVPKDGEQAVLKVSAVRPGYFDSSEVKVLPRGTSFPASARLRDGDLLITRANTRDLVGAVCRVGVAPKGYFLCDKTLRLNPRTEMVEPEYLLEVLQSRSVRQQIEGAATGTSASMKNISQESIRALLIPLVDIVGRSAWVGRLQSLRALSRATHDYVTALRRLRSALLFDLLSGVHEIPDSYDDLLSA